MNGNISASAVRLLEIAVGLTRVAEEIEQIGKVFTGTAAGIALLSIRDRLILDIYALRSIAALADRELARKQGS